MTKVMKIAQITLASAITLCASTSQAMDWNFGVQAGIARGGDSLDGTGIDAGEGTLYGVYAMSSLPNSDLKIKLTVSQLSDSSQGDYSKAELSRLPVDLTLIKKVNRASLEAGLTYHINGEIVVNDSFLNSKTTTKMKDALGLVLGARYEVYSNDSMAADIGLRYTHIDYKFEGVTKEFDASSFALTAGLSF